jgi:hypothetical protein
VRWVLAERVAVDQLFYSDVVAMGALIERLTYQAEEGNS